VSVRHLCAVCLMVCLGAAAPARAQSEPTGNDPADSALKDIDDIVGGAYIPSELRDNPVQPPAGSESTIFEIYPLAERDNPLIDHQCRAQAIKEGVATDPEHARAENESYQQHASRLEQGHFPGDGHNHSRDDFLTNAEYQAHLEDCEVCGPTVNRILHCHVEGIRQRPKTVVFFDVGATRLSDTQRQRLRRFLAENGADGRRVMIISRASDLSTAERPEDPHLNARLARERAQAVQRHLMSLGMAYQDIKIKEAVWTPPRLNDMRVASAYGIDAELERLMRTDARYANQSAVVVMY